MGWRGGGNLERRHIPFVPSERWGMVVVVA